MKALVSHGCRLGWVTLLFMSAIHGGKLEASPAAPPSIPRMFVQDVPASCRQIVLVLAGSEKDVRGSLWLLERRGPADGWRSVGSGIPVTLGRNGMAWGAGQHSGLAPKGFRVKREGDNCSPAGVFRLPYAFGYALKASEVRLPYLQMTGTMRGVDDGRSRYYNQIVNEAVVKKDWSRSEKMRRDDEMYRWGVFVAHNPRNTAGAGSCIFLHIWRGQGEPTAGCTAMAERDIRRVLAWLDRGKEPSLVQGLAGW